MNILYLSGRNIPYIDTKLSSLSERHNVCVCSMYDRVFFFPFLLKFLRSDIIFTGCSFLSFPYLLFIFAMLFKKRVVVEFYGAYSEVKGRFFSTIIKFLSKNLFKKLALTYIVPSPEHAFFIRGLVSTGDVVNVLNYEEIQALPSERSSVRGFATYFDIDSREIFLENLQQFPLLAKRFPHLNFFILIKGKLTKKLIKFIRSIPPNCHYIPYRSGMNFTWLAGRATFFVDCSEDSDGSVCLEALAHGMLPVIPDRGTLPCMLARESHIMSFSGEVESLSAVIAELGDASSHRDLILGRVKRSFAEMGIGTSYLGIFD